MLRWRILVGTVLIAALAGLCWMDFHASPPGVVLLPLALLIGLAATQELLVLLAAGGLQPRPTVVYGGNLLVLLSNVPALWWPDKAGGLYDADGRMAAARLAWPFAAFVLAAIWALGSEMRHYVRPGGAIVRAAAAIFAFFYVGVLLSFIIQLRVVGGPTQGMVALVALITVVKLGDTGAYVVGRLAGRHRLAPALSPAKTVEGFVGGIACSCLGAWIVLRHVWPSLAPDSVRHVWWDWPLFGIVVGLAGVFGDLAESLLKRDMKCKDSSRWMPGLGGILDVVDSLLMAGPAAYVCWILLAAYGTGRGS